MLGCYATLNLWRNPKTNRYFRLYTSPSCRVVQVEGIKTMSKSTDPEHFFQTEYEHSIVSSERNLAESSATLSLRPVVRLSNLQISMAIPFGWRARFLL